MLTALLTVFCSDNRLQDGKNGVRSVEGKGERLAKLYCGGCHLFPEPALLERDMWRDKVLPAMAYRLGIGDSVNHPLQQIPYYERYAIEQANIFPKEALVTSEEWREIKNYYEKFSPQEILPSRDTLSPKMLDLFKVRPKAANSDKLPLTTLVSIDTVHRQLIVGNRHNDILLYDFEGRQLDRKPMSTPPVDCTVFGDTSLYVLSIGIMDPNDRDLGTIELMGYHKNKWDPKRPRVIAKFLKRPVSFLLSDFDKDSQTDIFVCNFGHHTGSFSLLEEKKTGIFKERTVLDKNPGARKVEKVDLNDDGWEDIIVLMTQGDESIIAYINKKGKGFEKRVLLRFPPVYGSSHIELVDWDNDNDLDIIYTNGDNADYTFSLKNYHGVRCFINEGNLKFNELFFIPIHGATKALTEDFDKDGDKDIAVIAYFADFERAPEMGFVYLENKGDEGFVRRTFVGSNRGRWLTMDKGDVDGDGDVDLLLGSFVYGATPVPEHVQKAWVNQGFEFVLLLNSYENL